ncbi:MAG: hypothetical protein Q7S40_27795 [Opitutaceae bacterium]|nr:hypothetical protein [Opitutaceae bacterium]
MNSIQLRLTAAVMTILLAVPAHPQTVASGSAGDPLMISGTDELRF